MSSLPSHTLYSKQQASPVRLNHSRDREWKWIGKGSGEEAEGGDDDVLSGGRGGVAAPTVEE